MTFTLPVHGADPKTTTVADLEEALNATLRGKTRALEAVDAALATRISAADLTRAAGDAALGDRLDSEAGARADADAALALALASGGAVYLSTDAGLAATAEGEAFLAYLEEAVAIYVNQGGSAVLRGSFAPTQALDAVGWKPRASEPPHERFKVRIAGRWYSPDPLVITCNAQSNGAQVAAAAGGDLTPSPEVLVWDHLAGKIVTLDPGASPFASAQPGRNYFPLHMGKYIATRLRRPVVVIPYAVSGSPIGAWMEAGEHWPVFAARVEAAFAAGGLLAGLSTVDVHIVDVVESAHDALISALSDRIYPDYLAQIRAWSRASAATRIIAVEALPQADGGAAWKANEGWRRTIASGRYSGVSLVSAAGLRAGPDGSNVHFDGPSLMELGHRIGRVITGESTGIASAERWIAADATGGMIWKEELYLRACVLSFGPTGDSPNTVSVGTIRAGLPVLFEQDGVFTETPTAGEPVLARHVIDSAVPSFVTLWYPAKSVGDDIASGERPGIEITMPAGQGALKALRVSPAFPLRYLFVQGHTDLDWSCDWQQLPASLTALRVINCPAVRFDGLHAAEMPAALAILGLNGCRIPGHLRAAIDAENAARGGKIAVSYGSDYLPEWVREAYPEDYGVPLEGQIDGEAAFIRYAARGGALRAKPGSVVRAATRTANVVFPAGTIARLEGLRFQQDYTLDNEGAVFRVQEGVTVADLSWHIGSLGGLPCWFQRGVIAEAGARLSNWTITADAPFPAGAVTDLRDGVISLRGPQITVENCEFHGHQKAITGYRGSGYRDCVIRNCRVHDMLSFVSLDNEGFERRLIEGIYVYSTHPLAAPDPGHNVVTGGAPYAVVRHVYQMFDGMGSGEHFIYSAVVDGTRGMSFAHIHARGSGQCFMKWRGHDGLRGTHLHGGPTSIGNAPGTNEDGFRLENCRNWALSDISMRLNPRFSEPAGYDSLHLKNSWNGVIRTAYLEKPRRCYIALCTPPGDPDYTSPPNEAVSDILIADLVAVGAEDNRPLILAVAENSETTVNVGNLTITGLDWDGQISRLVEADMGMMIHRVPGTTILIDGTVRGRRITYEWLAGSSPVITYHSPADLVEPVAALEALSVPAGQKAFATDATASSFGSVAEGGGSNFVPVFFDGVNWRIG